MSIWKPLAGYRNHLELLGISESFGSLWELLGAFVNPLLPLGTFGNFWWFPKAYWNIWESMGPFGSLLKHLGASGSLYERPEAYLSLWEPLRTFVRLCEPLGFLDWVVVGLGNGELGVGAVVRARLRAVRVRMTFELRQTLGGYGILWEPLGSFWNL